MHLGRTMISTLLAVSLAACGGGGGGGGGGGTAGGGSSGGDTGGGADACSLSERQDWVLGQLDEWYLFPTLLDKSVNQNAHNTVQSYIDALVAPARAESKDRFFTYITSIQEENELINSGSNAGFGVRLAVDAAANRLFVLESFENAPALAAGIDRGTEILAINGQSVADIMASGGTQALNEALGPSEPGVSRTLRVRTVSGVERTESITKTEFSLDPVSDRYGVRVFTDNGEKIGYVNLRTFIVASANSDLRAAFGRFKSQGINKVILDFRYNGGGLIAVADVLGDLLAADKVGKVYSRTTFRASQAENNETRLFAAEEQAISATKIAVIGRGGTASASELVTNAFIPYLGVNIALIGTDTFGKPVGQIALDRSACDDRLRAVAFRTENANGQGDYYTGLASVMQATCRADDEIFAPLGDSSEASISVALDYLAGRSCTPIAESATDSSARAPSATVPSGRTSFARSRGLELGLLEASRADGGPDAPLPSAAQLEIPGLF